MLRQVRRSKDGRAMRTTKLMTAKDLAKKVHWEGGIVSALEYGIRSDEIDDPELAVLWRRLEGLYDQLRPSIVVTDRLLRAARLGSES
jgi:hypothetical protein